MSLEEKLKRVDAARRVALERKKAPKVSEVRTDFLAFGPFTDRLLYHMGQKMFYMYEDGYYKLLEDEVLFSAIDDFCVMTYGTKFDVTERNMREVYKSLIRHTSTETFRRVQPTHEPIYSTFTDKIFNFETLTTQPISKDTPSFHKLDFPFPTQRIATPHFDEYLATTFVTPQGEQDFELQSFMLTTLAFYISPLNSESMAVILTGGGANGKSVFLDLLRAIVGESFIASITMESLSRRFGAAALVGKRLNVVSEDQSRFINAGKIKALISQENIEIERKFQDPGSFRPTAKHIWSTNKDVRFEEIDFAITRRIAVIPFHRTFVPPESPLLDNVMVVPRDKDLIRRTSTGYSGKLIDEMPGIMYKVVQRLKELSDSGYEISFPTAVRATQKEIESASTNALDFFHTMYTVDNTYKELMSAEEVYNQYTEWYNTTYSSDKYIMSSRNFWSALNKNFPTIKTSQKVHSTIFGKTTAAKQHMRPKDSSEDDFFAQINPNN